MTHITELCGVNPCPHEGIYPVITSIADGSVRLRVWVCEQHKQVLERLDAS